MSELLVCTCNYGGPHNIWRLLVSCSKHQVPISVFGQGQWPGWAVAKIRHAKEFLERRKEQYVLFTDGHDSFLTGGTDEILDRFLSMRKDIVISAEKNCWPDEYLIPRYPEHVSPWKYLCAGGWIGKRDAIIPVLECLEKMPQFEGNNDQACWSHWYCDEANYITTSLDYKCEIFQTMFLTTEMDENGINTYTGTRPLVWHFNGDKREIDPWFSKLVQKSPIVEIINETI